MGTADTANIKKRSSLGRPLTFSEGDTNLDELINIITDVETLESSQTSSISAIQDQLDTLEDEVDDHLVAADPHPVYKNSSNINYSNTISGLTATTVKTAIDELASEKLDTSSAFSGSYDDLTDKPDHNDISNRTVTDAHPASAISYTAYSDGLSSDNLQDATDELNAMIDYINDGLAQIVTVAKTGGQYSTIQSAIDSISDATSIKRYGILIYPGDYSENVVLGDYISVFGIGSRGLVKITASTGSVLTFNTGSNNQISNIHLAATGTAKIVDIPSGSTSRLNILDSKLTYSSATDYVDAITHASGELHIINTEAIYTNSGTTTGDNEHVFYSMTGSTAFYYFDRFDIEMNIADASDTAVGIEEYNTTLDNEATRSTLVINCTGGADAIGARFKGSGSNKRINRTNLFLYGNGGTGKTITTNGDGCTINLEFNDSGVTGFDLNYQAEVASGDTANATFGLGEGEQGTIENGEINIIISNDPGSFVCQDFIATDSMLALVDATSLVAGQLQTYFGIVANKVGSTGGEHHVIDVTSTNSGSANVIALGTGSNVSPIHQHIGDDAALGKAWSVDSTAWTDRTTAFNTAGTDVQLFNADNDVVYIGSATTFSAIPMIFATASNITINPTFEYWNGAWTSFTPNDGTVGMSQSGTIALPDLTGDWATTTVNSEVDGPWYYVRITRTRNFVGTPPTESLVQVQDASSSTYSWDDQGEVHVKQLKTDVDITNFSNPPTDAELDSAFGTPATVGAGWRKSINDNNGGANFYEVQSDGTNWWITTWTMAT